MQSFWLLLEKPSAPLWWISVFWLLICLNRNYLYILVRLSDSPCDYCLWKWEWRSRKFPCHQSLMYSQIMGWLQLRWAPRRIVFLRLWQLPPWQGLLVFLVIDAFCINAICWWCLPPCRDEGKASGCVCVSVGVEMGYLIHTEAGRRASAWAPWMFFIHRSSGKLIKSKTSFKGASAWGYLSEPLLGEKEGCSACRVGCGETTRAMSFKSQIWTELH